MLDSFELSQLEKSAKSHKTANKMGKKNSKLKQDTIDRLTTDTYCKYCIHWWINLVHSDCKKKKIKLSSYFSTTSCVTFSFYIIFFHFFRVFFCSQFHFCWFDWTWLPLYSDVLPFRYEVFIGYEPFFFPFFICVILTMHIPFVPFYTHTHICCHL